MELFRLAREKLFGTFEESRWWWFSVNPNLALITMSSFKIPWSFLESPVDIESNHNGD